MLNNDWTIKQLAAEHQRDLRRQAEAERFANEHVRRPDRSMRWLTWLGQQLIITGERLQVQHKAAVTSAATRAALNAASHRSQAR